MRSTTEATDIEQAGRMYLETYALLNQLSIRTQFGRKNYWPKLVFFNHSPGVSERFWSNVCRRRGELAFLMVPKWHAIGWHCKILACASLPASRFVPPLRLLATYLWMRSKENAPWLTNIVSWTRHCCTVAVRIFVKNEVSTAAFGTLTAMKIKWRCWKASSICKETHQSN